ncbi:uncharacterized protein [Aristolochia californica]|uniref:uncharacterized protein n=1 Tax=Aristolochia californica TaxID=171875 RepID=UPI0035D79062
MTKTMGKAVQLYPKSPSFATSSLCDAAVLEASKNTKSPLESSFRGREVKKLTTQKRKAYFLCCSSKKRREAAAGVNRTHRGNHILRRALLLEARKRFLAHRLKQMAATLDTVSSELRPVMEETKGVLDQLLSIEHKNDVDDTRIINGSLVEKFKSLLERCAMKEDEILNTTKAIQEKMQEILS